eukprot:COSAG05_NODE_4185_length_1633_cov_1.773142_2_plen_151_part_00
MQQQCWLGPASWLIARQQQLPGYGEHSPYKFLKIAPIRARDIAIRNECVTRMHSMGVLMSGRGPWDYHGPRVSYSETEVMGATRDKFVHTPTCQRQRHWRGKLDLGVAVYVIHSVAENLVLVVWDNVIFEDFCRRSRVDIAKRMGPTTAS